MLCFYENKLEMSLEIATLMEFYFQKGSQSAIISLWIAYGIKLVKRMPYDPHSVP